MSKIALRPRENLIHRVASFLIESVGVEKLSRTTVVFPNKRPKHFLLRFISQHVLKPFIPPKTLSIDEFIEELYRRIYPNSMRISPSEGVFLIHRIMKEKSQGNQGELLSRFERFFPYGVKLFQAFEELYVENVSAQSVGEVELCQGEFQNLSRIYREFYDLLEKEGYATRSLMYSKVAESLDVEHLNFTENLIFCGFYGLTKSEELLFNKIEGFYEKKLKEGIFVSFQYEVEEAPEQSAEIYIYETPDRHGQAFAVGKILEQSMCSEDTVIVLPSEELLFPLIRQGLNLSQNEYNISLGYPILRTPIWGLFEAVATLVERSFSDERGRRFFVSEDYLRVVLHPYVKNIKFNNDASTTRILFHCIENCLREEAGLVVTLEQIEETIFERALTNSKELEKLEVAKLKEHVSGIHDRLITPFLQTGTIKEFASNCLRVLDFIYKNSTAPYHPFFFPFFSSFVEQIHQLENSLLCYESFSEPIDYFVFLKNYLKSARTPFEGLPIKGVQILGFLETRNLRFKNVFFLDLNEEVFPPLFEDFVLPNGVRKKLSLPTLEDRERLIEYYFRILIDGAEKVYLFCVRDERRERSRFIEKLLWEREKRGLTVPLSSVNYRLNLSADRPKEVEKRDYHVEFLKEMTYSPSSIDTYIKCPLRFYYSYVLRLKQKEDLDLDSAQIGKIVHSVLSKFFKRFTRNERVTHDAIQAISVSDLVTEEFKLRFGEMIFGDLFLIKRQIEKRVLEIVEKYYGELSKRTELFIIDTDYPLHFVLHQVKISGIIDIIERRAQRVIIVDYKTSASEQNFRVNLAQVEELLSDTQGKVLLSHRIYKSVKSIQIPLYMVGYSKVKQINPQNLSGLYLLIGRTKLKEIEYYPFQGYEDTSKALELTEALLGRIFEEILNPQIPFYPTKNYRLECPYCDFKTVCGTLWVKGRSY